MLDRFEIMDLKRFDHDATLPAFFVQPRRKLERLLVDVTPVKVESTKIKSNLGIPLSRGSHPEAVLGCVTILPKLETFC
jgi:hypothetical protein